MMSVALHVLSWLSLVQGLPSPLAVWPLNTAHPLEDISGHGYHATTDTPVQIDNDPNGPVGGAAILHSSADGNYMVEKGPCIKFKKSYTVAFLIKQGNSSIGYPFEFRQQAAKWMRLYLSTNNVWMHNYNEQGVRTAGGFQIAFTPSIWEFAALVYDFDTGIETLHIRRLGRSSTATFSMGQMYHSVNETMGIGVGFASWGNVFDASMSCLMFFGDALDSADLLTIEQAAWDGCIEKDFPVYEYTFVVGHGFSVPFHKVNSTYASQAQYTVRSIADCAVQCHSFCGCVAFTVERKTYGKLCELYNILNTNLLQPDPLSHYYYFDQLEVLK